MLHQDYYVREKLRELESEQLVLLSRNAKPKPDLRRSAVIGPAARRAGRLLRCLGESLESWAGMEPEPMRLERNPR